MADRVGFEIDSRFYPFPSAFRLADPVLVEELTGLEWDEFVDRLPGDDDEDGEGADPVALVGLVGVAVWQANPRWRRERVVRFVQAISQDAIQFEAPDSEEANGGPPAGAAGEPTSRPSASTSDSGSDTDLSSSTPPPSGTPTSPTSPEGPSG